MDEGLTGHSASLLPLSSEEGGGIMDGTTTTSTAAIWGGDVESHGLLASAIAHQTPHVAPVEDNGMAWSITAGQDDNKENYTITTDITHNNNTATFTSFPLSMARALSVQVQDPKRHGEGTSSAHVTYQLTTQTTLETYSSSTPPSVRRRFQDFIWLHRRLTDEFPFCILPPLPDKHRMDYIRGQRFSPEFIERRRVELQHYCDRITRHPILQASLALRSFLEDEHLVCKDPPPKAKDFIFENVSDAFINTFSRPKLADPQSIQSRETISKLEDQLISVERLHVKMTKSREEERKALLELSELIKTMAGMETLVSGLESCGDKIAELSTLHQQKMEAEEVKYFTHLHDYIMYCASAKDAIKQNEQKQAEYEALCVYLDDHNTERVKTADPRRHASGIAGFVREKTNALLGIHPETARRQHLAKIEGKIGELEIAVRDSKLVAERFAMETQKEVDLFLSFKDFDFAACMGKFNEIQQKHHDLCANFWEGISSLFCQVNHVGSGIAAAAAAISS